MESVVFITGGARRIGASIARELAEAGWQIALHSNCSAREGESLAAALRAKGAKVELFSCDLSDLDAAQSLVDAVCGRLGGVDALVNNAALFSRSPLLDTSVAEMERLWRVNTLAPMILTRDFARVVRSQNKTGAVVNLLDQRIFHSSTGALAYQSSKHALAGFTKDAARELAPDVRVNAVAPGAVLSPESSLGREKAGGFLLPARPSVAQIARTVRFLLENEAITGETICVDSGQHLLA